MSRFNQTTGGGGVQLREMLSALVDSELSPRETETTLDALRHNERLQSGWQSMHLISTALQASDSRPMIRASADFAGKLEEALEAEPTVIAPKPSLMFSAAQRRDKQDGFDGDLPSSFLKRATATSGSAWAMAAGILLAVGLISVPFFRGQAPQSNINVASQDITDNHLVEVAELTPSQAAELEALVVEHGEFTGMAALNGLLAYAKVVNQQVGR